MSLPAEPPDAHPRKQVSSQERQLFLNYWACSLLTGGRVACWGQGQFTKNEDWTNASVLPGLTDVVDLDRGEDRLCGLSGAGKVKCVPVGKYPVSPTRAPFEGLSGVAELEGGCARLVNGQVKCMDSLRGKVVTHGALAFASRLYPFDEGACGLVGTKAICVTNKTPAEPVDLEDVVEMGASYGVFCGRSPDGRVRCRDPFGYDPIIEIGALRGTTHLTLTRGSVCGITGAGEVVCSGLSAEGDFGVRAAENDPRIPGVEHARALALTMRAGCALLEDGRVACFRQRPSALDKRPPCLTPFTDVVEIQSFAEPKTDVLCVRRTGGEVACFVPDSDARRVVGLP
jgi:hypothetical protein